MPATDLEQDLLGLMRTAMSDTEIGDWGRVYRESVQKLGTLDVVPDAITARPATSGFSFDDLRAGFAAVNAEHLAQPSTALVDREVVAAGGSVDSPEFLAGMREYGFGVTVFDGQRREADAPQPFSCKLDLENFYVQRAVGDQFGGRDEIYWCSTASSDKTRGRAYRSEEFGAVKTGQTRAVSASNRTVFEGSVDKAVVLSLSCWEADQSTSAWYDALHLYLQKMAEYLFDTITWGISPRCREPAWSAGWVSST
ncbi:hypothetical protein EDD96_0162 [Streptomyces sp. Ag109_G2-6]|uniref:hypothetical protein n=1 Tax=Streptomyces TaxID=1883 RepID=UPI0009A520F2|nr:MULTISPECIES: hypothetical protein [Streptomyces]RPF43660.1 hypothetical protein EDD96_0162 [Streptomyces sp. Ag109_G2-6]